MAHLLDGFGDFSVRWGWQAWLIPIVDFASLVQELGQHWCIPPVDVFLLDGAHVTSTNLSSCHWSVEERGRFFHFKRELPVLLVNNVALSIIAVSFNKRSVISVLFPVFPSRCQCVVLVLNLEVGLNTRQRVINAHILAKSFLDYSLNREFFCRAD